MGEANIPKNGTLVEALTWREQDILALLAERHTDREIAQSLGLELTTVKWYNKQLYSKLGVGSRYEAVAKAEEYGLLDEPHSAPPAEGDPSKSTLPVQITSFVGREREMAEVKRLLQEAHLLSLTGPAGTGKTRLAVQVAAEFADDIYFVDLAPISQPELVGDTIAGVLGVKVSAGQSISETLATYLRNKHSLLLLDNFEHLLEAAPLVGDLLSAAPDLKVLATSREALRLYGEQEYLVPPLKLPNLSNPEAPLDLADYESAMLFVQRARAVKPGFNPTDADVLAVAEICLRLDGLPLAIELAAARVKLFSPQALLGQMESRFSALAEGPRGLPERQQTLRGAIDWSYDLLDGAEKSLFARLAVFQGGRTIEAVDAVCCHDMNLDVVDGLESLLHKNLLRLEEGLEGEPRFIMLETIHEYARERLQASGDANELQRRHAEYFTELAEQAEPHTRGGPDQMRWLRRLEGEHDNLRTMYAWSMESGDVELGLRLVGALGYFWWRQGHYAEGQQWTARALEVIEGAPSPLRASVLSAAGRVSFYLDDPDTSKRVLGEALSLYRELGARRDIGWTLIHLTMPSIGQPHEYEQATALGEEGLALLREAGDRPGIAQALNNLGELARLQGDLPRAKEAYTECLDVAREMGDTMREAIQYFNLGFIAQREGDPEQAQALLQQSLSLCLDIGHKVDAVAAMHALAGTAGALGHLERAARLFGAAEAVYDAQGFIPQAGDLPEFERSRANVREQFDEATFNTLWAEGQALSLEEAFTYALEEPPSD